MNPQPHRDYEREIVTALELVRPRDAVARVKEVVISEIERLDREARISSTEYFNHTFAPDLVLSWPDAPSMFRYVFLRFNDDLAYLADGLRALETPDPFIFGLTSTPREHLDRETLRQVAVETQALVTDPAAVETLIESRDATPVLSLMASGITRGGRGLLDQSAAEHAATIVAKGFEGARELAADPTGQATRLLDDLLDERQAGQLSRFLQAIWVGSGGRIDLFPGQASLSGDLADEALTFLLTFDEIDDLEFWHRLGHAVTVEQLGRVTPNESSLNLQHLVRANLDRLWARACVVVPEQARLGQGNEPFTWVVERNLLGLRGEDFTAYVSERTDDIRALAKATPLPGIDVDVLRTRAQGIVLNSLRLSDGREAVVLDSESNDDVAQSDRFSKIASAFSPNAKVQQAHATVIAGQELNIDFRILLASGNTASKPLLKDLVGTSLPLLRGLMPENRRALDSLLLIPDEIRGPDLQGSLFSDGYE